MLRSPFFLLPETTLVQAMREVVTRHYPVYPVCEEDGTLVGQVRGQTLFEQQAFEISAQAGAMVGVEKEERLATPLMRSFKFRHPWLQINLLTVFVSAAVVGMFQGHDRQDRGARDVPAGAWRPERQSRLPVAGGAAARHDAGRIARHEGRARCSARKRCWA